MMATVDWLNDSLGYGFATCEDGSKIFLHQRFIQMSGYRILFKGDIIEFQPARDDEGRLYAKNIVRIAERKK